MQARVFTKQVEWVCIWADNWTQMIICSKKKSKTSSILNFSANNVAIYFYQVKLKKLRILLESRIWQIPRLGWCQPSANLPFWNLYIYICVQQKDRFRFISRSGKRNSSIGYVSHHKQHITEAQPHHAIYNQSRNVL